MKQEYSNSTYTIVEDSLYDNRVELQNLIQLHYQELATDKELMVLDPDWDKYKTLEQQSKLFTLLVYTKDGELVGYSSNVVDSSIHYKQLILSTNDVIFLHKDHRGLALGLELIAQTEAVAYLHGADAQAWHSKPDTPLDKLLSSRQYPVQDIIRVKKF